MVNFRVKIILLQLQLLTLVIFPVAVSSQPSSEMKKIFAQAESYYLFEDYELANQLYILLETPDNLNIKYKIGVCYLNIPGEKEKSIPYLEAAILTSSYDSKTESFIEMRAPVDAYFYLAKAYMTNNELEKGLITFLTFKNITRDTKLEMKNLDYINQEIQACKNAIQFKKNPVFLNKRTMGSDFSQGSINEKPAVSFDGNTIVYTERRGLVNDILFSRKENDIWQPPREITSEIKAGNDCSSCSLNSDGTELYLYKTGNFDGDIYSSNYINGIWSPIKRLNKNINTKYYESHASISSDGKKLYFTSNRKGGVGNLDIYVSEKDGNGNWGPAVNLGSAVNTPFNEDTPFITQNDSALYFCSEGHNSMGGFDNFKSIKVGPDWKTPSNLGFPINSTDDDNFFQPVNNGLNGYYSMTTDYKKKEIFYLSLKDTGISAVNDTTIIKIVPSPVVIVPSPVAIVPSPVAYEDINLSKIPHVSAVDTTILIKNMNVNDVSDKNVDDSDVLYYTVQVMALYNPVDVSYFKYITDMKIMYNDLDKFYRYTTGRFSTKEEAYTWRQELTKKGYPEEIFIKKVSK
ncbi:MAG: hypothetical protein WCS03_06630 [Bacteroidota bacterium]